MKLNTEHITKNSRYWNNVNELAKEAFPPEEYIAPAELAEMAKADNFDFLALKDGDSFVGFMAVMTYENLAYLFFLAIDSACRSKGYGSRAIETLKAEYPGKKQIVDFEMPDDTADNSRQREKRREFYLRNGYKETGLFLSYLGVDYEVFCMNDDFEPEVFKAMMKTIHVKGFKPKYFGDGQSSTDC
ncbi:MAG TPA: GNAT family N-acetyltransferase [Candidatus Mediterraneibacter intestinigallinarum]|nr:GNAT family N-acetyltransferase [Candidatus Mediterraneibacter intestinigallinarum]